MELLLGNLCEQLKWRLLLLGIFKKVDETIQCPIHNLFGLLILFHRLKFVVERFFFFSISFTVEIRSELSTK